jgi:hypothetical protein
LPRACYLSPCGCGAAEKCDELAPPHSTSCVTLSPVQQFNAAASMGRLTVNVHVDCVLRISTGTAIGVSGLLIGTRIVALRRRRLVCIRRDPLAHRVSRRPSTPPRMPLRRVPQLASPTRLSAGAQAARQLIGAPSVPPPDYLRTRARPFRIFAIAAVHGLASTDVALRSNATPTNKTAAAGRFVTTRDVLIPSPVSFSSARRSNLRLAPGV